MCIFIDYDIQLVIVIQWALYCYMSLYPAAIDGDDWKSIANYQKCVCIAIRSPLSPAQRTSEFNPTLTQR